MTLNRKKKKKNHISKVAELIFKAESNYSQGFWMDKRKNRQEKYITSTKESILLRQHIIKTLL